MSNSKYEITDIAHKTYPFLHRIRALQDIGDWAKAGDLGGFVESESNLAVDPDDAAWIFNDAIACGSAYVDQDSILMNDAIACDRAYVSYGSALYGSARVEDDAYLRGALMYGRTRASGCAQLLCGADRAEGPLLSGHCQVFGTVRGCLRFSGSIKDSWETIPGNSDTLLYLGGNEASTHKYISEALGKSTIDTKTHGQTKGRSGSYSTNFQMSGRELLTPDEVRMLDNRYCILFIRGTRPVMDEKYELMEHPAIRYTMDGGGPPYIHHGTVEPPIPGKPLFQIEFDNEKENAAA